MEGRALNPRVRSFLETFFRKLEQKGIQYCILHTHEKVLEEPQGDIDFAIDKIGFDHMHEILSGICPAYGITPLQAFYYDVPKAKKWICATGSPDQPCLALDFNSDHVGINPFVQTDLFLSRRQCYGAYYALPPALEFIYYLDKKVRKRNMTDDHVAKLMRLYYSDVQCCNELIEKTFGKDGVRLVKQLLFDKDLSQRGRRSTLSRLRIVLLARFFFFRPWRLPLWILWSAKRTVNRVRHPTGLIVAFISPDGGGKSTLADRLAKSMGYAFDGRISLFHWRPCLLPPPRQMLDPRRWGKPDPVNTNPHGARMRPAWLSFTRFFYYYMDYLLGFCLKLFLRKVCCNLVLMDRYYYDFLIDRIRFGLKIPSWLPRLLLPTVPKVDILFFLSGRAEDIYARKPEVSVSEIERQLNAIRNLKHLLGNVREIDVSRPLEIVNEDVNRIVLNDLSDRLQRRYHYPASIEN